MFLAVLALSILSAATSTVTPELHLDAPIMLRSGVRDGVARERPDAIFRENVEENALLVQIEERANGWSLRTSLRGRPLDERELGAEREAAIRLAVLLIVDRLGDLPDEPTITNTETATRTEAAPAVIPPPPPPPRSFRVELAFDFDSWASPLSLRTGISAALFYRVTKLSVGVRLRGSGLCCEISGEGIDGNARAFAAMAEAAYPVSSWFSVMGAAGFVHEVVDAHPQDGVFEGPGALEAASQTSVLGRIGFRGDFALPADFGLTFAFGAELLSGSLSVRLPPPYSSGREPLDRGQLGPFLVAGGSYAF